MNLDPVAVRAALARLPIVAAHESLTPPPGADIYVPHLHVRALQPDATVVVGARGAGKSFWTAVLANKVSREVAASLAPQGRLAYLDTIDVRVGFGLDETNEHFPSADTLRQMRLAGLGARDLWWAVIVHHAAACAGLVPGWPDGGWQVRASWLRAHPEAREAVLTACDEVQRQRGRTLLVLFDALDRVSSDWDESRALTKGALEVALALRSRRALRMKLFLRPDLDEDSGIWAFPDASKLQQGRVLLRWSVGDLYAMLWSRLANDREVKEGVLAWLRQQHAPVGVNAYGVYRAWPLLDGMGEALMSGVASPFMGTNKRRGRTFRWIPLHLADAKEGISPRSWLIAFRAAAEHTQAHRPDFEKALHHEAIQHGVVQASRTRVAEIAEDYPWVHALLAAASGLTVPCAPEDLMACWEAVDLATMSGTKLPPRRYATDSAWRGLLGVLVYDLVDLGVAYWTADRRVNLPDIFRVGFGIKRKGGVRPAR